MRILRTNSRCDFKSKHLRVIYFIIFFYLINIPSVTYANGDCANVRIAQFKSSTFTIFCVCGGELLVKFAFYPVFRRLNPAKG